VYLDARTNEAAASIAPATRAAIESASAAGLRYVSDAVPGLTRVRGCGGFRYRTPEKRTIRNARDLERIRRLAIPPAWEQVWICADERGHLQATGFDARGRKQYRYHPEWRRVRDENKYERLAQFARALPRIRRRVHKDLADPGLSRNKVTAAVVRLLEVTLIRIGNERYAREHGSFGLTTLRNRHVSVNGRTIRFRFNGKSHRSHAVEMSDARLASLIRRCRELPGYELFRYVEEGEIHAVGSAEVNAYLQAAAGADYTAKDFRTWGGTVLAVQAFERLRKGRTGKRSLGRDEINAVVAAVAAQLGNTVAICRKCYIHPGVIEAFAAGRAIDASRTRTGLSALETRTLAVLAAAADSLVLAPAPSARARS
jgi:DNA topoisomerase-1